ncbi:MAG: cupin domain-containing protein [Chloroflexota bacterium]
MNIQTVTKRQPEVLKFVANGQGESFWWKGGSCIVFKVDASYSDGVYALTEARIVEGGGVSPHMHPHEVEAFYMLDGSIEVRVGSHTFDAKSGDFVSIPKNVAHEFWNRGPEEANFINPFAPAGLEQMFRKGGVPRWTHPHPPEDNEERFQAATAAASSFGTVGKPDELSWQDREGLVISASAERGPGLHTLAVIPVEGGDCVCSEAVVAHGSALALGDVLGENVSVFVVEGSGETTCGIPFSQGDTLAFGMKDGVSLRAGVNGLRLFLLSVQQGIAGS